MNCSCDPSIASLCPEGERLKEEWQRAYRRATRGGGSGAAGEKYAWQVYEQHLRSCKPPAPTRTSPRRILFPGDVVCVRRFTRSDEDWRVERLTRGPGGELTFETVVPKMDEGACDLLGRLAKVGEPLRITAPRIEPA